MLKNQYQKLHKFPDLGFIAFSEAMPHGLKYLGVNANSHDNDKCYFVDFEVYEVCNLPENDGWRGDDITGLHFRGDDGNIVRDIKEAEPYLSGGVKWDGCSNWIFDENTRYHCLHFCNKQQMINVGILLGRLHDIAHDLMPLADWDKQDPRS